MKQSNNEVARKIVSDNIYMTIATADKNGEPWISPVVFGYDKNYNFYWFSDKDSKHSRLIKQNNRVAVIIFNSKASEGTGDGVYVVGGASEVSEKELGHAISTHADRFGSTQPKEEFMGDSPLRFYKIVSEKFWKLNDPVKVKGHFVDYRLEVDPREP